MNNTITSNYEEIKDFYDNNLNMDKKTFKTSNDEPTPISCVEEMVNKIPNKFWEKDNLKILDPCCGNGNFHAVIYQKLAQHHTADNILEKILHFNDINDLRIQNVENIFQKNIYKLNITKQDFLEYPESHKFDLVVANPPYAKILANGKRASKNHNLIKPFIEKTLKLLNKNGYLLYITPDNWMSYADRNKLIEQLTSLDIIYLNIHTAKKYFKKIGSSFTWYLIQNSSSRKQFCVEGIWKKKIYKTLVKSEKRKYIPLYYNRTIQRILHKTLDTDLPKYKIETSSDLHKYTKKKLISDISDNEHQYRLIHTPSQTVYASRPHKYQDGYKVFISTTTYYKVFVDNCGMTQSIVFIRCENEEKANQIKKILEHPLYVFLNNICRYGNFNNIRILQSFPVVNSYETLMDELKLTDKEKKFIMKQVK
tara:strand:- start:4185 stop:5456 length:1272 start_codon:yes stop_codon:yes gene_type:complete